MSPAKAPCITFSGDSNRNKGGCEWKGICTLQKNDDVDGKERERGKKEKVSLCITGKETELVLAKFSALITYTLLFNHCIALCLTLGQ